MLKIVADSSMDMPADWDKKYEIDVLPVNIQFGDQTFRQGIDITATKFYKMINETKIISHTSLPSPAQVVEYYKRIAQKGETILSIHVGSKMSGTYDVVRSASDELAGEIDVHPFDSGNGSAGLAFMCKEARLLSIAGANIKSIISRLEEIRDQITVVFAIDNLEFARMNGRVSALQERVVSLLRIKPIIVLRDGILEIAERVRTRKKSIDRIVDLIYKRIGTQKVNIAIVHAQNPDTANVLLNLVREKLKIEEYIMTDLSISVAANLGPGTVGIIAYPVGKMGLEGK
jgi:DegV family protein with EDD domain